MSIPITDLRLFRYRIPLVKPLRLGGRVLEEREGLIVRLEAEDGSVGWGEAAPLPGFSAEDVRTAARQLRRLRPKLIGRAKAGGRASDDPTAGLAPSARFGVELALDHLARAIYGETGRMPDAMPEPVVYVNGLITGDGEEVLAQARAMREEGYRTVKLKVGRGSVSADVQLVHAVREAVGPDVQIRLDANRAWSLEEARAFAAVINDSAVEYVEEPLAGASRLQELVKQTGLPVALDESMPGLQPADLAAHGYASAVVLKPTFLGGLHATRAFARAAAERGMKTVVSAAFESGLALSSMIVFAASLRTNGTAMGFDTYRWLAEDVMHPPLDMTGGRVDVKALLHTPPTVQIDRLEPL